MPKKWFKRWMPDRAKLQNHKHLQIFGKFIHDPNLWHLNRYSVATAFSVGIFCAFIPIPFQMVLAAAIAIIVHANLPISIALVWITNPLTMPPIFYFAYRVGAAILNLELKRFNFDISIEWLMESFKTIGMPFLIGCLVCGIIGAIVSNFVVRLLWRYSVSKNWNERRMKRRKKKSPKTIKKRKSLLSLRRKKKSK